MRDAAATIAIVGAGSIGVAFAVQFARAGATVRLWDPDPDALLRARVEVADRLGMLARRGLIHEPVDAVAARIGLHDILYDALRGAALVQECAPERIEVKHELFRSIGAFSEADAILASSSSALTPTQIAQTTSARDRVIVAHPGNPPYLLPVIEIVPSRFVADELTTRAVGMYRTLGMRPIVVRKEVEGFVFNRLQGALLREAYCLVRDGVVDAADIDELVRFGLGRRWAVVGPFETVDLNTRGGIAAHARIMGPAYARMGAERGQHDPWTDDLVARVVAERRDILPLPEWPEAVQRRDDALMRVAAALDEVMPAEHSSTRPTSISVG